jgi:hypothetical protein
MCNIKILVCCHKTAKMPKNEIYMPIHVGKALSSEDLHIQGDDTGDNISMKNKTYCELTGMYWAWKNLKNVDYIGLCHYRRFFDFSSSRIFEKQISENEITESTKFFNPSLLFSTDVILSKKIVYPYSLKIQYSEWHYSEDYWILKNIVKELYPSYLEDFTFIFEKNNKLSPYNMFVTKWTLFDDYCNWLFSILKTAEERIDLSNYSTNQARIFGYFAERLLNVYVRKNHLKTKYIPILFVGKKKQDPFLNKLKYRIKCEISFLCQKKWC